MPASTKRYNESSVAALFDGQGIYGPGMGEQVYKEHATAREIFKGASEIVGIDITRVCFGDLAHYQDEPRILQPAIVTVGLAEYVAWREKEARDADVVTGLSLGMYAAYGAAGVFESYEDAVGIAAHRARIVDGLDKNRGRVGKMTAIIGATLQDLEGIVHRVGAEVAVIRDRVREHFVITGEEHEVEEAKNEAKNAGAHRTEDLKIPGAWHSKIQKEASSPFREVFQSLKIRPPKISLLSNTATYLETPKSVIDHSVEQLTQTSDWDAVIATLAHQGIRRVVECGPDSKRGLAKQMSRYYSTDVINFP